jgi:hypothetical protein
MLNPSLKDNFIYRIIIAHYISSALFFLMACVLLMFSGEAFIGHYFHPKILAITHITTLGWITFIIIGSLYQLIPVITNKKIYSSIIASFVYFFMLIGTILLAVSFWIFDVGFLIETAACILFFGITLFLINILLSIKNSEEKNIVIDFIQASIFWFWLTAFIGTLLAFNFRYAFLPKEHLHYLKIHAHIGLIGWFLCLIIGVASKLIPMFLLSTKLNAKPLTICYYLINIGLLGYIIDALFLNGQERLLVYVVIILTGILFFLYYIANVFKTRVRRKLDINFKHVYLSFLSISIPMILWFISKLNLISDKKIELQISSAIVFSLLFGYITLLILGQAFRNLTFIVWMNKYQDVVGKSKTPLPKDLYSEQLAYIQLYLFIIGFLTSLFGILISNSLCIKIGAIFLNGTALLYLFNIFKIILHKTKTLSI